jgi:hypothetical protein
MNGFLADMVSLVIEIQFLISLKNDQFVAIPFVLKYPRNIRATYFLPLLGQTFDPD